MPPRQRALPTDFDSRLARIVAADGRQALAGMSRVGSGRGKGRGNQSVLANAVEPADPVDVLSGFKGDAEINATSTLVSVPHGVTDATPSMLDFQVTPTNNLGNASQFWISAVSVTHLTIAIDVAPGSGNTAMFVWQYLPLTVAPQPPFAPPDIAGLTFWIDATIIAGAVDGAALSTWDDLSGNSAHVSNGDPASQPTYETDVVNGLPVVRFLPSDRLVTSSAKQFVNVTTGEWTAFAVASKRTDVNVKGILTGDYIGGSTARVAQFLRYNATTPQSIAWNGAVTDSAANVAGAAFCVEEAVRSTTTIERLVNGLTNGSTAAASPITSTSGLGVGVGTGLSGVLSGFWDGDIAEVLLYNSALSAGNRDTIRDYLAEKWGITV